MYSIPKKLRLVYSIIAILIISACTRHSIVTRSALVGIRPLHKYNAKDTSIAPNYQDTSMWLVHKYNNKAVDVFFVHPTTYINPMHWNMPLYDSLAIKLAYEYSVKPQLSVFYDIGNIYAPRYRQATFYAFVTKFKDGEQALNLATKDILNAWNYYIKNINKGRPIIIAGHSQGSMIILKLLPQIMKNKEIAKRIIVVYAIGWPITYKYLKKNPQIKVCQDSLQTGCVISWNTESKNATATIINKPSISVNPLSWSTNDLLAPKELNKGAVFFHNKRKADTIPNYVSAQNIKGHLIVSKIPNVLELNIKTAFGVYHIFDYNMFYLNIKQNVADRTMNYFKNNKK